MILHTNPAPCLSACASALPARQVDQGASAEVLRHRFPGESPDFVTGLVMRSGIDRRHIVRDPEEILHRSSFSERNLRYREEAAPLALEAARKALAQACLDPERIDVLIDVSCTGVQLPALDVALVPGLGLRPDVRRIPVTEAGCAAGALALGTAAVMAQSGLTVLIVAVELASLTFCPDDDSRTNLVASALFGDGAAAAVVQPGGPGPRFVATSSHLLPNTQDAMGFDVGSHGLRIQLQRELPFVLVRHLRPVIEGFLASHDRTLEDVGLHLVHPGGRRILDAYEDLFSLAPDDLAFSRASLANYGNLSSASILTVLELALSSPEGLPADKDTLLFGVGPGLSLELSLLSVAD